MVLGEFWRGRALRASEHAFQIVAVVVSKTKVDEADIVVGAGDEDVLGQKRRWKLLHDEGDAFCWI